MTVEGRRTRKGRNAENWFAFLLALPMFFTIGCADPAEEPVLADSTMVDIMLEFHLADARAQVTRDLPAGIRDSILQAYEVDSVAYARTIWYYAEHPEKYEEIYGRVLDRLNSERIPLGRPDNLLPNPDDTENPGEPVSPNEMSAADVPLRTAASRRAAQRGAEGSAEEGGAAGPNTEQ